MDGEGVLSANTYYLMVNINPMDTRAPIVTKNKGENYGSYNKARDCVDNS